jgi:hypothetical protein
VLRGVERHAERVLVSSIEAAQDQQPVAHLLDRPRGRGHQSVAGVDDQRQVSERELLEPMSQGGERGDVPAGVGGRHGSSGGQCLAGHLRRVEGRVEGIPDGRQRERIRLACTLGLLLELQTGCDRHPHQPAGDGQPIVVTDGEGGGLAPCQQLGDGLRSPKAPYGDGGRDSPPQPRRGVPDLHLGCEQGVDRRHRVAGSAGPLVGARQGPQQPQTELGVAFGGPRERGDEVLVVGVDQRDDVVGRTGDAEFLEPVGPPDGVRVT